MEDIELKACEDNFLNKVNKTDTCWIWKSGKNTAGYGVFQNTLAHRFAYMLYKGDIPEKMPVCHTCDNPSCVNPDHLWIGTNKQDRMQNDTYVRKSIPERFIRIRLPHILYKKYKTLCAINDLSLPKQTAELIRKFVEIHEENNMRRKL